MNEELVKLYIKWLKNDGIDTNTWEKIDSTTKGGVMFNSKEYEKAEDLLQKIKNSVLFKALNE